MPPGLEAARIIEFPVVPDPRGKLTFIEGARHVPFSIRRVYWVYDVPGGERRGAGHAYRELEEVVIALSGGFDVVVDGGRGTRRYHLDRAHLGLYVPRLVWRSLENFSTNGVCLVLASLPFSEADYVRDYREFTSLARNPV